MGNLAIKVTSALRRIALASCVFAASVTASSAISDDRVLRVLLVADRVYPILNLGTTPGNGVRTSISVADCPMFDSPIFKGAFRFEVELMILCNAISDADLADRLEFVGFPNLKRAISDLVEGNADFLGTSVFPVKITDGILASDPVLRRGEFQVGLFTTANRDDVLGIESQEDLFRLTGITERNWEVDLLTLNGMGLRDVVAARKMTLIPDMIAASRADFTLSYLDRPTTEHMGDPLVRIDGFRASMNLERVLAFSPSNSELRNVVNAYIHRMRALPVDRLYEGYKNSGFIVDTYEDWVDVTNPQ
ncbi:hypothetical protein [Ascidiaceihabitans sp.]|uniref:hypothetical protein n=1 Tax=Ascidiaceihabitans sp. TaxID=1872644 RepID=UPI003298F794